MQADSSSLFLGMILFWFLSFQYYKRYGKKTAKNLTFLCKVAPVYGTYYVRSRTARPFKDSPEIIVGDITLI